MVSRGRYQFSDVQRDSLLLVEGIDDARFLDAFLRSIKKPDVQIATVGGTPNFGPFLSGILTRASNFPRLKKLALVRDADTDAQAAFQSIYALLNRAGLPAPAQSWGTAQQDELAVSVAILPDGKSPGNLEDLCLRSIEGSHEGMKALKCVDGYLFCRNPATVPKSKRSKARLHSYLAVADEPGRRLGEAADAKVWDWNSPTLQPLAQFLRQL